MRALFRKLKTYRRLGLLNAMAVISYRAKLRSGYFANLMPIEPAFTDKQFYQAFDSLRDNQLSPLKNLYAFGHIDIDTTIIPRWLQSVVNGKEVKDNTLHWSELDDFSLNIGDIKGVWELSRMDWLLHFAINFRATGDNKYLATLNNWLADWVKVNPCNQGVNWKCGQEASIRVIHLVLAADILNQLEKPVDALVRLVSQHLERIAPTLSYAKAQDNNHGTSEAAALFIGSLFLQRAPEYGASHKRLVKWLQLGRQLLENRSRKLICVDGNFSQNSVNYHRFMLDTLSMAEYFRSKYGAKTFTQHFYDKAKQATWWLMGLTNHHSGFTPNFGLNDGANLLPVTSSDYRDFRPSLQLASLIFMKALPFPEHESAKQLCTLFAADAKLTEWPNHIKMAQSQHQYQTGLLKLSNKVFTAYVRAHDAKFRPSACDALHLDLWCGSQNIFTGTGSYSYNSDDGLSDYFNQVEAHNTVQFDQLQQMPKLSRFLYADWLYCTRKQGINKLITAYQNTYKHKHSRSVTLASEDEIQITDSISGFKHKATLRWHLNDVKWQQQGNQFSTQDFIIKFDCDRSDLTISLVANWGSYYYANKTPITVIEVEVTQDCTIKTIIKRQSCA